MVLLSSGHTELEGSGYQAASSMAALRSDLSEKGRLALQADGRRVNTPSKVNRQRLPLK
jgi:hypothetical protein